MGSRQLRQNYPAPLRYSSSSLDRYSDSSGYGWPGVGTSSLDRIAAPQQQKKTPDIKKQRSATRKATKRTLARDRCTVLKAVLSRLLFVAHSLVSVWRAAEVAGPLWWALLFALVFLLIESVVTIGMRKGNEWRLFCPSVLFFLVGSVPGIWLMELDKFSRYNDQLNETISRISDEQAGSGISIPIPIDIDQRTWIQGIEQSLMIILIIGRWLLPKGKMTRGELSALLLVYVGLAADIIELFDIFEEESVLRSHYFIYAVLGVWTWSLLQFVIVVSGTGSGQGTRLPDVDASRPEEETKSSGQNCCTWEVSSIILSVLLQDGPFLGVRLAAIIMFKVYTYSNFFFTAKNLFVVVLQVYRLFGITCCADDDDDDA